MIHYPHHFLVILKLPALIFNKLFIYRQIWHITPLIGFDDIQQKKEFTR
jgi:hypothetical protein